jgi:hypothetical protein
VHLSHAHLRSSALAVVSIQNRISVGQRVVKCQLSSHALHTDYEGMARQRSPALHELQCCAGWPACIATTSDNTCSGALANNEAGYTLVPQCGCSTTCKIISPKSVEICLDTTLLKESCSHAVRPVCPGRGAPCSNLHSEPCSHETSPCLPPRSRAGGSACAAPASAICQWCVTDEHNKHESPAEPMVWVRVKYTDRSCLHRSS